MPTPGPLELVIILVIALLILGPGKLPEVGSALGKSIREFRKASTDIQDSVKVDTSPLPAETPAASAAAAAPVAVAAAAPVAAAAAPVAAAPVVDAPVAPPAPVVAEPATPVAVEPAPVATAPSEPISGAN